MVNDVYRDAYDNPYMLNIVKLIRTMFKVQSLTLLYFEQHCAI